MNIKQLQAIAPAAAGLILVLALLITLLSLRLFRKSRTDSYWRRRRAAGQQGWRLLTFALFLMLVSGLICTSGGLVGLVLRSVETPTALVMLSTPSLTPSPRLSPTIIPTITVIEPATPTLFIPTSAPLATDLPTETETVLPLPSATPTFTLPPPSPSAPPTDTLTTPRSVILTDTVSITLSPTPSITESTATITITATNTPQTALSLVLEPTRLQSSVTPPADAVLKITALDREISGALGPINPASSFTAGFNRIYFFVTFSGMQSGMLWRGALLMNGRLINHYERLWGTTQSGSGYFFFGQENGFQAGEYEIKLYLGAGGDPVTTASFTVTSK